MSRFIQEYIIDFHTHAFPDDLAPRAMERLSQSSQIQPFTDGTITGLLRSMDTAGIAMSVVHSIATDPSQTTSIRRWASSIRSPRITSFASVHPDSETIEKDLHGISQAGFIGVKLHPEYQDFYVDDEKLRSIYNVCEEQGLIVFFHAGTDISFPASDKGSPKRIAALLDTFENLTIVAAHMGGWQMWEETARYLVGRNIFIETSYSRGFLNDHLFKEILLNHRPDRLLFGSDSPWDDQASSIAHLRGLGLPTPLLDNIFSRNALHLLHK